MAEMYEKIDNHIDEAKGRMVQRFADKQWIDTIIELEAERWQKLEDVIFKMLTERAISTGSGVALDGLGEFYGEQGLRNNRSDEEYKAFLTVLPSKLRQAGQHEVLVSAFKNLTNAANIITEYHYPRALSMKALVDNFTDLRSQENINDSMQSIRAQGVRLDVGLQVNENAFIFSGLPEGGAEGQGFSEDAEGSTGIFDVFMTDYVEYNLTTEDDFIITTEDGFEIITDYLL